MRRGLLVGGVIAAVVAAAGVGWLAGQGIKSPAELAAEAEPPEPSLITVEVERIELSADVIVRADIGYDEPASLTLGGSLGGRPTVLVATSTRAEGAELEEGAVAIEVSGRPVFVLEGEIPAFRDLRPGAVGVDVLQLEEALGRLGHLEGEPDDTWDDVTGEAVAGWYESAGYLVNGRSEDEDGLIDGGRRRVGAANQAVAAAREAIRQAREGPSAAQILSSEVGVAAAEEELRQARLDIDGSAVRAEEAQRAALRARELAAREYTAAETRWQSAASGVHPETGGFPTPAELEQFRLAYEDAGEELRQSEQAIGEAADAVEAAAIQATAAVRSAEAQLALVREQHAELIAPPDLTELNRQLDDALEELEAARTDLADLQAGTGTWIPAGELIFLKRLPVRVDRATVARGDTVTGSFMTVTGSDLAIRGTVSSRDVDRVLEGASARIEDSDLADPLPAVIRRVDERAGTSGAGADRHYLELVAEGIPDELIGRNVKVVIPVSSTAGEVLAVPAAALSATADGSSRVEVEQPDGSTRFVTVEPGLAAAGLVEVTALDGPLEEGDRVVVGYATAD